MKNNILITLPGFEHNNFIINFYLLYLINKYPHYFYDNIKIESIYDNFPCIWGGGRAIPGEGMITNERIATAITPFLAQGIQIRYNFTNCLLEEKHLYDENCNNIVKESIKIANRYNSRIGIVINSPILEKYLRENYPELEFIYSTTIGQIGLEEINKRTKNNILVLDYMYNNNFEFLQKLENPQNIEILANEACLPNCPHRNLHFKIYSAIQLGRIKIMDNRINASCLNNDKNIKDSIESIQVQMDNFIKNYLPLKINKLKIVGRLTTIEELANTYSQWLVKPEYRNEIRRMLNEWKDFN